MIASHDWKASKNVGGPQFVSITKQDLPVLSTIAKTAMIIINSELATIDDLEDLICIDQGLTSRVIRIANSPLYAGTEKTGNIKQAMIRLGLDGLKLIIIIASTGDLFNKDDQVVKRLWHHAVSTAVISKYISEKLQISSPGECFTAGLLHDIGKTIIYSKAPDIYELILKEEHEENLPFYKCEQKILKPASHVTVGSLVASEWFLDTGITHAIRFHHRVEENQSICNRARPIVNIVSTANLIANKFENPDSVNLLEAYPTIKLSIGAPFLERATEELPTLIQDQKSSFEP